MEAKSSRVRWDEQELSRLANEMAPRLLADPGLHPLDAVRAAQECLAPDRRRELKAWSLVEGRLQPKLDEVLARLRARPSATPAAEEGGPPAPSSGLAAGGAVDVADARSGPPDEAAVQEHGGERAVAAGEPAARLGQSADLFGDRGRSPVCRERLRRRLPWQRPCRPRTTSRRRGQRP